MNDVLYWASWAFFFVCFLAGLVGTILLVASKAEFK